MPASLKTAVLITCYNRKETTINCLKYLEKQDVDLDIFLFDDNSPDGTQKDVIQNHPNVNILKGDGNAYWCGGMRALYDTVFKLEKHDFILWLNDDVTLLENSLEKLFFYYNEIKKIESKDFLLIGSTCKSDKKTTSYGGRNWNRSPLSASYDLVDAPIEKPIQCDTINGNIVLIPFALAKKVGNIHPRLVQTMGDLDYGLRVRIHGHNNWVAPGFFGVCENNSPLGTWADKNLSTWDRLKDILSIKNAPFGPWTYFIKRHGGLLWPIYWFFPYIRAIIGYKNTNEKLR